jgi:hypothetical protein
MGVKDTVTAGLIVCRHVDSDEGYCVMSKMVRLNEQILLIWSVIDIMIKSLLPCVSYASKHLGTMPITLYFFKKGHSIFVTK